MVQASPSSRKSLSNIITKYYSYIYTPHSSKTATRTEQRKEYCANQTAKMFLPALSLATIRKMKYFTNPSLSPQITPLSTSADRRPWASLRMCARLGGVRACVCAPKRTHPSLPGTGQPAQGLSACVSLHPGRAPSAFLVHRNLPLTCTPSMEGTQALVQ